AKPIEVVEDISSLKVDGKKASLKFIPQLLNWSKYLPRVPAWEREECRPRSQPPDWPQLLALQRSSPTPQPLATFSSLSPISSASKPIPIHQQSPRLMVPAPPRIPCLRIHNWPRYSISGVAHLQDHPAH